MESLISEFYKAHNELDGYRLANTLSPIAPANQPNRIRNIVQSTNSVSVEREIRPRLQRGGSSSYKLSNEEVKAWVEIYVTYWEALAELYKLEVPPSTRNTGSWSKVYSLWKELTLKLIRGYTEYGFEAWTVPCLYVTAKYMRIFGIKADREIGDSGSSSAGFQDDFATDAGKNEKLEDAARVLNRIFQTCLSDRAPLEESRKWGIYNIVNLLFKTYFKLNAISLSKNLIRALRATKGDMPDLAAFPMSHQVTFEYYLGVIYFLEENYVEAEEHLTSAWNMCHKKATSNKELILTYLIPCHLLTTHTLPTPSLLSAYPHLQRLFLPLCACIRAGDLAGFDRALAVAEDDFVRRRIYLTLERGRDIALRNLLRRVFLAGGFVEENGGGTAAATGKGKGDENRPKDVVAGGGGGSGVRRTRIPVAEFGAAINIGSKESMEADEVECLLANMIYKNLMKGYIARERGIVVLSKGGAFPGTKV